MTVKSFLKSLKPSDEPGMQWDDNNSMSRTVMAAQEQIPDASQKNSSMQQYNRQQMAMYQNNPAMMVEQPPKQPLQVVELFQSQGCSSCPPANDNIIDLSTNPDYLVLTYEVTYWDHLGWKDTFGREAFDKRQRHYCQALEKNSCYTPQVCKVSKLSSYLFFSSFSTGISFFCFFLRTV